MKIRSARCLYRGAIGSVIAFLFVSCATKGIPITGVETLQMGSTRADVAELFGSQGNHLYLGEISGEAVRVVSYSMVKTYNDYLFAFQDERLIKIQKLYTVDSSVFDRKYNKDHIEAGQRWHAIDKVSMLLARPGLNPEELQSELTGFVESQRGNRPSFNLWPIAIATVPFLPVTYSVDAAESVGKFRENKFSGSASSIHLGMSEAEVTEEIGAEPSYRAEKQERVALSFGPGDFETLRGDYERRVLWITLYLENDRVASIVGRELFDESEAALRF